MFGKYFTGRMDVDEIDSSDRDKQGCKDAPWLNKRVGNAPRNSRKLNIADLDEKSDVVDNDDVQKQMEMISNRKSNLINERDGTVKDNSNGRENSDLHRKPSYQVISDGFGDMKLEDSIGFPQQNRILSTARGDQIRAGSKELLDRKNEDFAGLQQGSGACRNSFGRRKSFDYELDNDETAMEIKELMKKNTISSTEGRRMLAEHQQRQNMSKGGIHRTDTGSNSGGGGSKRRRSFELESDNEEAEEIKELIRNETLSAVEGRKRLQDLQTRGSSNRGVSQTNQPMGSPHTFASDGLPQNWCRDSHMSHSEFRLVPLCDGDREYVQIYSEMEQAGLDVVRVERLQNVDLLEKFKSEMKHLARRKNSDEDLNIRYLYHGTSVDKTCICEEGLDQRLSRMGYFGKGIYFSDNPLKCVNYAGSSDRKGESYLLKCRVILGDQKCYRSGEYNTMLKREPEKENPRPGSWKFYDSVMGCPKDLNEFVIYENRRAMIDYIITFKVSQQGQDTIRERIPSPIFDSQGRETGFVGVAGFGGDDDHFDRISQVREAIRRKRCEERGQDYEAPDEEKKRKDKEMWQRLQKLHNVDANTLPSLEEKTARMRHAASEPQFQPEDPEEAFMENAANTTLFPHSQSFTYGGGDDEVEQVMSALISEFTEVTSCDNSETARYYIDKCQMNIDQAIVCYYDDMP